MNWDTHFQEQAKEAAKQPTGLDLAQQARQAQAAMEKEKPANKD